MSSLGFSHASHHPLPVPLFFIFGQEYYEGYPTLPDTSNYWRFIPSRFSRAAIPYASFVVPEKCTAMCATSSSTYQERLEARFAAGVGGNLVRIAAAE